MLTMTCKWVGLCLVGLLKVVTAHAGTVTYVYTDPQGTPLAEADAQGNITARFDYSPYGSIALGTAPNGPGYTGHVNDPETGLIYMQQRYDDPSGGRFLSPDPVGVSPGNVLSFNRYAYANDNPVRFTDPDGRCPDTNFGCGAMVQSFGANPVSMQTAMLAASFLPIVGDAVNIADAVNNPSFSSIAIAVVGVAAPEVGALGRAGKEIYTGSKLARSMAKVDRGVVKGEEQAHHIVAANAKAAEPARAILAKHGIDINSAANGAAMKTAAHQAVHTKAYYQSVNDSIRAADKAGGKPAVEQQLQRICKDISGGGC